MSRRKRSDHLGAVIAPVPRFWGALATLPAFLLFEEIILRFLFVCIFAVLALAAGKRIRWGYFLLLLISVSFFHLLAPLGRVLLEIGPFVITEGALRGGVNRALGLIGMVFLSVAAVRPELELPGRFGGLLGRTFYYFDEVIEGKKSLDRRNFFASLDRLLLERFDPGQPDFAGAETAGDEPLKTKIGATVEEKDPTKHRAAGIQGLHWAVLFGIVVWTLWILATIRLI